MSQQPDQPRRRPGPADVRPRYGERSLSDVLPGVLAALGAPDVHDPLGLATGPLAEIRAVAVLLVDGLGHDLISLAGPYAPVLRDLAAAPSDPGTLKVLTVGFPSTTPTSLTSLGTGAAPGVHGLLGFRVNIPGTDAILNHVDWSSQPDPLRWQPVPTQFDRAAAAGINGYVVTRPEFMGSGLSRAAYRGGTEIGAVGVDATVAAMLAALAAATTPTLVYGYHSDLDQTGHVYGVDSPQWRSAVTEVDRMVGMLVAGLPPGTALVVTADHGQLDVPAGHRFDLDTDPVLRAGVRVVAGEPRVRYLHTKPGASADVLAAWQGVLGEAAWVVTRDEAVAQGWFGPVPEDHLRRIGDVVVACHADYVVLATRSEPAVVASLVAYHGSATEAEMLVPLLIARP